MMKISPENHGTIRIEIYEWNNTQQKDVLVGDYEVSASNGQLKIQGYKNWIKETRPHIEVEYYLNEPEFKQHIIHPFQGIYIKQVLPVVNKQVKQE